ncbi:MAG TPA: DUF3656 domain-containing protein [Coriobacteriia bacterium]|nr:DUF3656 domain-containing protein [Coriobacteriia bacterium]
MPDSARDHRPELLAPAGGPDALRAAVNNGADAVYLGLDRLNARRGAENFTLASLGEATRYAHLRGARVYLAANVVVKPHEVRDALEMVDEAWALGVDAVIIQDLGLARVIARELPEVRLHASTQMNAHNAATVTELARLGFSRVTLARELSLAQIAVIARNAEVEVETFVHGALCFCYSGQCFLSSAIGGRSANRGLCAQPCRLPYELLDEDGRSVKLPGRYPLSLKDLAGVSALARLRAAGVNALKIEGRMKSAEYVAVVTAVYRSALDRAILDPEHFEVTEAERASLAEAFNRGFTAGHLDGARGEQLVGFRRPNNRGVPVGRVTAVSQGVATVSFERPVEAGDTLEFWTRRGRFAQRVPSYAVDGTERAVVAAGSTAAVRVDGTLSPGDRVFRVTSAALERAARRTYGDQESGRIVPADIRVVARTGTPLEIEVTARGHVGAAVGPVLEAARTKPLTVAEITEHVGRLGGTPFVARSWDVEIDQGVGAGFSLLHSVRRSAIERLERSLLAGYETRAPRHPPARPSRGRMRGRVVMPEVVVWTTRPRTAGACRAAGANRVIVPWWATDAATTAPGDGVVTEIDRIVHDRDVREVLRAATPGRELVVGNLGLLRPAAEAGAEVWTHWSMNVLNAHAVDALADAGAGGVWLSPEISGREAATVVADSPVPVGLAVLGRQELMVTEHCVLSSDDGCSRTCATCSRRGRWHALRDRKGYHFPVVVDSRGRSHIFNAVPLDLTRALPEMVEAGVAAVRLDFTMEAPQVAQRLTSQVRQALEDVVAGRDVSTRTLLEPSTSGQFFRGVP